MNAIDEALAKAMNEDFYVFVYGVLPNGFSAFEHYVNIGWREGRDPNPWFSTDAYLNHYPDVAGAGLVPLVHFLQTGAAEGRTAAASIHARSYYLRGIDSLPGAEASEAAAVHPEPPMADEAIAAQWRSTQHEFNWEFYRAINGDVANAGMDLLFHYLREGWKEGRDPTPLFSTRDYLEANPDVAEAGVNPFYHYIVAGRLEGRPLRFDAGVRHKVIANMRTIDERIADCVRLPASRVATRDVLLEELSKLSRSAGKNVFISVSHDDFTANVGGLQFCLLREAEALRRGDVDHVHLFPADPLLVTNREDADPAVGVLVNDKMVGYFLATDVAAALETTSEEREWPRRSFAVHSMLGHNSAALVSILKSAGMTRGFFWLHDYASICAGLNLLRNDVEYCHAPPPDSAACTLCVYGSRRSLQAADHIELFRNFEISVLAPSQAALSVWRTAAEVEVAREVVHPHCELLARSPEKSADDWTPGQPIRIAFLGYRATHKGWPMYRDLALRFARDKRYAFFHLGKSPEPGLPMTFREVSVAATAQNAMIDAIENLRIDVAVIWSLWPETFCLTAHEAIAGGAIVLAPPSSGNVPHLIRSSGRGMVVADEAELEGLFDSGRIRSIVRRSRPRTFFSLNYSDMTADFISAR